MPTETATTSKKKIDKEVVKPNTISTSDKPDTKEPEIELLPEPAIHFKLLSKTNPVNRDNPLFHGPITQKALGLWFMCKNANKDNVRKIVGGFDSRLDDVFLAVKTSTATNGKAGWPAVCKNCKHPGHGKLTIGDAVICGCGHFHVLDPSKTYQDKCDMCKCVKYRKDGTCKSCKCINYEHEKQFARGCPTRPRHGFVESRTVESLDETLTVFNEALLADPQAELILMPYVNAICSAVYVPQSGSLAIGEGHDGATGGHNSLIIPVNVAQVDKEILEGAGIAPNEHMYLELVCSNSPSTANKQSSRSVRLVQARSGPPREMGINEYIPVTMQISRVLEPTGDLMAWEVLTQELKGTPGLVAWQKGGNLFDHAAIHASMNGIAFLTRDKRPEVGDLVTPPAVSKPPFNHKEFWLGVKSKVKDRSEDLALSIGLLHNSVQMVYSPHQGLCLGYSLGHVFRMAALACLGELRHNAKNPDGQPKPYGYLRPARQEVYKANDGKKITELCDLLSARLLEFVWEGGWSGDGNSYGGWKWFACGVQAVKLFNFISRCGDPAVIPQAVAEANILLHMSHNGGWLFNKFLMDNEQEKAAANPGLYIATRISKLWDVLSMAGGKPTTSLKPRTARMYPSWKLEPKGIIGGRMQFNSSQGPLIGRVMDEAGKKILLDCEEQM